MIKVKTDSGFECEVDENVVNKYAFVKSIAKVEKNPATIADIVGLLIGDQEDALIEHLGGDPDAAAIINEVSNIIGAISENAKVKKS